MKMCVSIVVAASLEKAEPNSFEEKILELGRFYGYGIGMGQHNLLPAARESVVRLLNDPELIFEVHDLAESHCACDIDQDIRNRCKEDRSQKIAEPL